MMASFREALITAARRNIYLGSHASVASTY
jgi:hypothetical protein